MAGKAIPEIYCSSVTVDRFTVHLASTSKGAVRVGLELLSTRHPVDFFKRIFPAARVMEDEPTNRPLAEAVQAALHNRLPLPPIPMDVSLTPFQWAVLETVAGIPFGETRTYRMVASMMGRPLAARAVGQVMARNPLPIIFPCHRVVAADGLGGFGGGLDVKRALLDYEGRRYKGLSLRIP